MLVDMAVTQVVENDLMEELRRIKAVSELSSFECLQEFPILFYFFL